MFATSIAAVAGGGRVFDYCIVGSGPAGITLTMALEQAGHSVLLLEAGGEHYDEASQEQYRGHVYGPMPYPLDIVRLRYFGGTSNHWGGFCRPLDGCDFGNKIAGIDSAWPIGRADLGPYLARSREILELSDVPADRPLDDELSQVFLSYSPPVNFASKYRPALERATRAVVALNACVVNLEEAGGRIRALEVADQTGQVHRIGAARVVLCAGGIENSRLLLWANHRNKGRVVRDPRSLGRYWMEHPHFTIGDALLVDAHPFRFDAWNLCFVAPTERAMHERGILNCGLRLQRRDYEGTKRIVQALSCVAPDISDRVFTRLGRRLVCGVMLRAACEQAPRPWNRVVLGDEKDAYGIPRVDLHWRYSEQERRTLRITAERFGDYLIRTGLGRLRLDSWLQEGGTFPLDDEIRGNHQMGGTRMSRDPATGVVDTDCRVHGLANLYVAGASVFPSAGHANPTQTLVQLACRLADHLNRTWT